MTSTPPPNILPPGASSPPPSGTIEVLAKAVEGFPRFLIVVLIDLLHAALTDSMSLALTGASVLLAVLTGSWIVGLVVYLLVYVVVRTVNNVSAAIGQSGQAAAAGLHHLAHSTQSSQQPPSE